jgi:hypothetical protein
MPYYVLGPGGTKFGPAEMPLLTQWAHEGRILPETLLEDGGGVKLPARALNGLTFPGSAAAAPHAAATSAPLPPQAAAPISPYGQTITPQYVPPAVQPPSPGFFPRGGSPDNTFLPSVGSNWAAQAFGFAVAAPLATLICGLDRIGILGLLAPIYGITLANRARPTNPSLATLAIIANVIGFIAGIGLLFARYSYLHY